MAEAPDVTVLVVITRGVGLDEVSTAEETGVGTEPDRAEGHRCRRAEHTAGPGNAARADERVNVLTVFSVGYFWHFDLLKKNTAEYTREKRFDCNENRNESSDDLQHIRHSNRNNSIYKYKIKRNKSQER